MYILLYFPAKPCVTPSPLLAALPCPERAYVNNRGQHSPAGHFWQNEQGSGKIWVELVVYCYYNLMEVVCNPREERVTPIIR